MAKKNGARDAGGGQARKAAGSSRSGKGLSGESTDALQALAREEEFGLPVADDAHEASPRKISCSDIQYVQNLIERCLQQYMAKKDVVHALHQQARIEPGFTTLVWQKLEEQNPDFFVAYHVRSKLKDQVILFNHLLDQQVQMIQKLHSSSHMQAPGMGGMQAGWPARQPPHMGMHHPMHHPAHTGVHGGNGYGSMQQIYPGMGDAGGMGAPYPDYGAQPSPNQVGGPGQGQTDGMGYPTGLQRQAPPTANTPGADASTPNMPKVFSLSDLTFELGNQLATEGDVSLSLLAGQESSGLGLSKDFSLGDIAKLETPTLDLGHD